MKTISKENVFNSVCRLRSPTFISQIRSRFLFRGRRFQGLCPTCPLFIFFCILINGGCKKLSFFTAPENLCLSDLSVFYASTDEITEMNSFCVKPSALIIKPAPLYKLGIVKAAVGNAYEQLDVIYNGFLLRSVEEAVVAQNTSVVVNFKIYVSREVRI